MDIQPARYIDGNFLTTAERLLRYSLAVIYIWFGALKPFGLSPAHGLVEATLGWTHIPELVGVLGICEVILGIMFLFPSITRITLILFFTHLLGTFFPMLFLTDVSYGEAPLVLSLIGQYIVKNLVFFAAGYTIWKLHHQP